MNIGVEDRGPPTGAAALAWHPSEAWAARARASSAVSTTRRGMRSIFAGRAFTSRPVETHAWI